MASQVAGVSSVKGAVIPLSARLAVMASRMAKKTEAAKKKGGSPTAWGERRGREDEGRKRKEGRKEGRLTHSLGREKREGG